MKRLIPNALLLLLLCVLFSATLNAQHSSSEKPALFSKFSTIINCPQAELNKAFTAAANQNINLSFSDNILFSGTVVSNVVKYSNLQTVLIKLPLYADAVFSLSKIIRKDNSVSYTGRIINPKFTDGYILKKDALNNYQLVKIELSGILKDCSQQ
jgi:hypothetical protein